MVANNCLILSLIVFKIGCMAASDAGGHTAGDLDNIFRDDFKRARRRIAADLAMREEFRCALDQAERVPDVRAYDLTTPGRVFVLKKFKGDQTKAEQLWAAYVTGMQALQNQAIDVGVKVERKAKKFRPAKSDK